MERASPLRGTLQNRSQALLLVVERVPPLRGTQATVLIRARLEEKSPPTSESIVLMLFCQWSRPVAMTWMSRKDRLSQLHVAVRGDV